MGGGSRGDAPALSRLPIPATKSPAETNLVQRSEKKLTPRQQAAIDVVKRADEKVKRRAERVINAAFKASQIDDDGMLVREDDPLKPKGWTATEWNIAKDARKPDKQRPGYLGMYQRVWESYRRADAENKPAPVLNADIKFYVHNEVRQYVVRDVTDVEVDE